MRLKRDRKEVDFRTKRVEYESPVQKPENGRTKLARDVDVILPDDLQACVADQDPSTFAQNYLDCNVQKFCQSKSSIDFRARLQDLKRKNGRECKKSQVFMSDCARSII